MRKEQADRIANAVWITMTTFRNAANEMEDDEAALVMNVIASSLIDLQSIAEDRTAESILSEMLAEVRAGDGANHDAI